MDASITFGNVLTLPRTIPMTKELRQSLEKLWSAADTTYALAVQMTELLKLREAVQKADEATARKGAKQRHREIISNAYRAQADAPEIEVQAKDRLATQRDSQASSRSEAQASDATPLKHLHEARIRNGTSKTKALPGRLFMRSQWR
jgi:hypothetical protein